MEQLSTTKSFNIENQYECTVLHWDNKTSFYTPRIPSQLQNSWSIFKMDELLLVEGQDFFTSHDEVTETFDAMGLLENLLRGLYVYGFEKPSAIQQRGIVPFTKGLDVIQQAQSGIGKTATFCSGILQQLPVSYLFY
nr:eukaryotic initiation factor 4A-8 [Tanacetum cinerariifolium]